MAFDDAKALRLDPVAEPERRGPGRPRGLPKPPGSGRQKGTPNRSTSEIRELIQRRGRPVELLAAIAAGRRVKVGKGQYAYPDLQERAAAAKILIDKLLPTPKPTETDTDDGERIPERHLPEGTSREVDLGRRLAFVLTQADRAIAAEKEQERDDDE